MKLSDDCTLAETLTAVSGGMLSRNRLAKLRRLLPGCIIHKYISEPEFDVKK